VVRGQDHRKRDYSQTAVSLHRNTAIDAANRLGDAARLTLPRHAKS
jgi:hypothetical protein